MNIQAHALSDHHIAPHKPEDILDPLPSNNRVPLNDQKLYFHSSAHGQDVGAVDHIL
jgi:hypothetical protein